MEKYSILLALFDKQQALIKKIYSNVTSVDLVSYEQKYVFALKVQQFYSAFEDLLKQIAKTFENHIDDLSSYHKELLIRLNLAIPNIRPAVLSKKSLLLMDKIRAFRHFIRHAYDCELDEGELRKIKDKLVSEYRFVEEDLKTFRVFIEELADME